MGFVTNFIRFPAV